MIEVELKKILKEVFGYDHFRHEQKGIITNLISGKDVLGIMPTGGGKSLCYQIPALYFDGVTLVISPLISLMEDQVMNLTEVGVKAHFLNSTQTAQEQGQVQKEIRVGLVKILYMSPEAVLSEYYLNFLSSLNISLIAIDEAHCVSQWGHEFRPDYTRLGEMKQRFPQTPFLALTATADERTRLDIVNQLRMSKPQIFVSSFDRPNIKYMIEDREDEIKQLDLFIKMNHSGDTGIIYCLSRKKVEKITAELCKLGYHAISYHAGLTSEMRSRHQQLFNKDEGIIVVATVAFGMGIDRPDVRFVAHLDLPKSLEGYYQETGRAGRDGEAATAWMVYGFQDVVKNAQMIETTSADLRYKQIAKEKLESMLTLCESTGCRRKYLLKYFGEILEKDCGYCDSCLNPAPTWNALIDSQKILSTIFRTGQIFGAGYIIDVLRGSKNQKISDRGHEKLSVYGIGSSESKEHWNLLLRQLLSLDYIFIKNWDYRSLALTEKASEILKGEKDIHLKKVKVKNKTLAKAQKVETHHENHDLFEKLRSLRFEISKKNQIPPYIVFSDKSLHEMCVFLPKSAEDFLLVSGVGQSKLEKYGSEFLKIINS